MEEVVEIQKPIQQDKELESKTQVAPPKQRVRGFTIVLFTLLLVSLVMVTNFKTAEVQGESMLPTLESGRKVFTSRAFWLVGPIKKNDIIVLKEETTKGYFIKRVLGLPGDKIPWSMAPRDWPLDKGPYIVPEGRIYVVGDNLNHSDDSRKFGAFLQSNILGKVLIWQ